MAVSGKTAAPWEAPYFLGTDKPPDMAAGTKALADWAHVVLAAENKQSLAWLKKGSAKQLVVCNASGVPQYVTGGGDVTNDEAGAFTIGSEKVTTGKVAAKAITLAKLAEALGLTEGYLADGAVSSRKVKPTIQIKTPSEAVALTTAFASIPGAKLEVTPAVTSTLLVFISVFKSAGENGITGTISVDGGADNAAWASNGNSGIGNATQFYVVTGLSAAAHTVQLRAKKPVESAATATLGTAGSLIAGVLFAS